MASTTVLYQVTVSNPSQSPAQNDRRGISLDIDYIDKNGNTQRLSSDTLSNGLSGYSLTFTGTVGQPYHLAARDIQNFGVCTVTVYENGSSVATANNATNVNIKAGVTGTL